MPKLKPDFNPFLQSFTFKAHWRLKKTPVIADVHQQWGTILHESEERCTTYTENTLLLFRSLSTSAKDMFMWIMHHVQYDSDIIEINPEKYCKEMDVHYNTFNAARKQLDGIVIDERKVRKNTYYINPAFFFKGKRIERYRDYAHITNKNPMEKYMSADESRSELSTPEPVGMKRVPSLDDVPAPVAAKS